MIAMIDEEASKISPLLFQGSDEQLVRAIRNGHLGASALLYDRYVGHVRGVLTRVMGVDAELPDLTNEVFYQALRSIHSLHDLERLKAWITRIAVFTARKCIRGRKRKSWLRFLPYNEVPEMGTTAHENDEAMRTVYAVREILAQMTANEQIVFSLRFIAGMEMSEIADACGYSERTAKRRLLQCETRFKALAKSNPALSARMAQSGKWRKR